MQKDNYLQQVIGLISSVFDAYSCLLFLPYEQTRYKLTYYFSLSDHLIEDCTLEPGQGLVGWIIENNQPLLTNSLDEKGKKLLYYDKKTEASIKTFMGVPLHEGQGVLCLDSKKQQAFDIKDQKILHQFAQLINNLYENLSRNSRKEQEIDYYQCLQSIKGLKDKYPQWKNFITNFLQTVSTYSGFSYSFFASRSKNETTYSLEGWNQKIFDKPELHQHKFYLEEGMIGWVFRNHKQLTHTSSKNSELKTPLFNKKTKTPGFKSITCLPLSINMRTRGVLVLADEEKLHISKDLQNFLYLVCEYLSLFLENLYFKNRLRRTA